MPLCTRQIYHQRTCSPGSAAANKQLLTKVSPWMFTSGGLLHATLSCTDVTSPHLVWPSASWTRDALLSRWGASKTTLPLDLFRWASTAPELQVTICQRGQRSKSRAQRPDATERFAVFVLRMLCWDKMGFPRQRRVLQVAASYGGLKNMFLFFCTIFLKLWLVVKNRAWGFASSLQNIRRQLPIYTSSRRRANRAQLRLSSCRF